MKKHPMSRDVRGERNPRYRPVWDRFWSKVRKTDKCWEWLAAKNAGGYGTFKVNGTNMLAHRFLMGAPKGVFVLHHCDNASCVNPKHLYFGDSKQNAFDRDSRNRNGYSKLTEEDVRWVRQLDAPVKDLAKCFGVAHSGISDIKNGKSYKWVYQEASNRWVDKGHI